MAPNMVTLAGIGFIALNVLTVFYYDPMLLSDTPRWTYFSYALFLFLYQTFDACDGSHARRTSQSGPLGEFFDHCIDSLNTSLSLLVFCGTVKIGFTFLTILIQFGLLCNFYLSTWEEYHTKKLFLSQFNGPVEGIILICCFYILTGMFGPDPIWHTEIFHLHLARIDLSIESCHLFFTFCGLGLFFNIYSARRNVINHYYYNYGVSKIAEKKIREASYGLVPFFGFFASIFLICLLEPAFISFPFILSNGFAIAFVVGRIIVAHLTLQSYPMINPPLFTPTLLCVLKLVLVNVLQCNSETVILSLNWMGFGLNLGIHTMFITEVIYEFTTYLDIYTLFIKHPKID